jgi:hypothetical protein
VNEIEGGNGIAMTTKSAKDAAKKPARKSSSRSDKAESTARQELIDTISRSRPVQQLLREIEEYPLELFRRICTLSERQRSAVPDYNLGLVPHLGEMALHALIDAELVQQVERDVRSLHTYEPTAQGKKIVRRLEVETSKTD